MTAAELRSVKKRVMARYERYSNTNLGGMIIERCPCAVSCAPYGVASRTSTLPALARGGAAGGGSQGSQRRTRWTLWAQPLGGTAPMPA